MFINIKDGNKSFNLFDLNDTNYPFSSDLTTANYYDKYIIFAVCSALLGLPSNILLLVILMRTGLFIRRHSSLTLTLKPATGSFERFLFEVVFIDTLLIIYDFVDNFLSYIHQDRSAGRHYLIHISDFCCKFFTYIAKMSIPLTTWLLLFLIINQLILTMENNNNHHHRSFWNRGLYYVNAKYSTVFLIFIFSVYNIYPIEVLKYQKKVDLQDYQHEGVPNVCSMGSEEQNKRLLIVTNYGYNLLGISIPCIIILIISIIIIYRTCRNNRYMNKEGVSLHYIAGTIGIIHALFNLPGRFSDILLMFLSSYGSFFPHLISFNHEAYSFISLSYGYKCFICIFISRRFRLHAKSVLCFLIENKYEDHHTIEIVNTTTNWPLLSKRKKHKRHYHHHHHHRTNPYLNPIPLTKPTSNNFSSLVLNKDDLERYRTSEATYWIRPYFTQNKRRHFLRPCGRSSSCHQISTIPSELPSTNNKFPKETSPNEFDPLLPYIISVTLPSGESVHLPLPQKRASKYRSSSLVKNRIDTSLEKDPMTQRLLSEVTEKQPINKINFLTSSHLY